MGQTIVTIWLQCWRSKLWRLMSALHLARALTRNDATSNTARENKLCRILKGNNLFSPCTAMRGVALNPAVWTIYSRWWHVLQQSFWVGSIIGCCQVFSLSVLFAANCLWSLRQLGSNSDPAMSSSAVRNANFHGHSASGTLRVFLGARCSHSCRCQTF